MLAAAGTPASHAKATSRLVGKRCARCSLHKVKCKIGSSRLVEPGAVCMSILCWEKERVVTVGGTMVASSGLVWRRAVACRCTGQAVHI